MAKTYQYPNFIKRHKGWYIYSARYVSDIPFRIVKKGRRVIYAESMRDAITDIDNAEKPAGR